MRPVPTSMRVPKGHASLTVQARGSRTSTQHVLRRLPHRRRRRRRARAPPRLRQGARFVRAREPRALGFVFPRHASAGLARAARGGGRPDPRARARARGAVLPRAQRRRRGEGRANHRHHHGCVPNANGPPKLGRLPVVIPREAPTWRATATKSRDAHADARSVSRSRHPDPSFPVSFAFPSNSTGVVSVALAVGYLALVQVIDSREMLPPPPEAMGMGECPPGERRC